MTKELIVRKGGADHRLQEALDALGPSVDHSAAIKHWSGDPAYRDAGAGENVG